MIFVTVGTQLPFDRLIRAVDTWAGTVPSLPVFAQTGRTTYRPQHMEWTSHIPATQFRRTVEQSSLIVAHAGMGTVLMARQMRKPMIVMPRRAALHEMRNDHQIATANWLRQLPGVTVCDDSDQLTAALNQGSWPLPAYLGETASPELLATIRNFIDAT